MAETASDKITTLETNTAVNYLNQLLNKTLRIHASDGRVFAGQFKCTDRVRLPLQLNVNNQLSFSRSKMLFWAIVKNIGS